MKAFFIQWVSVFLCFGTLGTPVFASLPAQPGSADLQTAGGNASLEDIPLAGRYAISSVIGNDREMYHGVVDGTDIFMENTVHQYSADFDDQGVALHFGDQRLLMTLKAYGYGAEF